MRSFEAGHFNHIMIKGIPKYSCYLVFFSLQYDTYSFYTCVLIFECEMKRPHPNAHETIQFNGNKTPNKICSTNLLCSERVQRRSLVRGKWAQPSGHRIGTCYSGRLKIQKEKEKLIRSDIFSRLSCSYHRAHIRMSAFEAAIIL